MEFKPLKGNAIVKLANDINKTKSGIIINNSQTEIWEIVALPDELPEYLQELKVGSKILTWKNWKGFVVKKLVEDDRQVEYICMDLPDVAAILE